MSDDAEQRIADLERELAAAKAAQRLQSVVPRGGGQDGLGPPPRPVPAVFFVAELLPFRWWYIFAMFMVAVAPIALWGAHPELIAPVAVGTLVVVYAAQLRGTIRRLALLKRGRVATVVDSEIVSRGSYYSGTTYYNVYLPQAHGWRVSRDRWSGPSTRTRVTYELDGQRGSLTLRGRSYDDGVVLADSRDPRRALCVSSFAYDLDRDESGNWVARLRPRLVLGMACWLLIVIVWLSLAVAIATGLAGRVVASMQTIELSPGGSAHVSGNDNTQLVDCNDGHLSVSGNSNTVTVHGHCASLVVSGNDNVVTVDSADTISVTGIDGRVTYLEGSPDVRRSGIDNHVERG